MVATSDSCLVKLVWSERKQGSKHRSLFEAAQRKGYGQGRPAMRRGVDSDSEGSDVEDSDEDEDSDGEAVAEGRARRGDSSSNSSSGGRWEVELMLSPTRTAFAVVPGTGGKVLEVRAPASVKGTQEGTVLGADGKPRFLFWLQQPYNSQAGLSASAALSSLGRQEAAPVSCTPASANSAAAATQDLQALLECPPDFSDQAGGIDVGSGLPGVSGSEPGLFRRRRAGRRPLGQPLQVGPLPRSLIEDLMKST